MSSVPSETLLIFAANPADTTRLRLEQEVREIENGLRNSRKHFEVKHQWATRPKDLRRALVDHKPAYVHFCGHGAGREGIVLEGTLVGAEALADLFRLFSTKIKCIVLNACYSTTQAVAIAKHIDFVVGMDAAIGDSAAIEFASAFYDALGAGESIEFAFELGRNAIHMAGIPQQLVPKLFTLADTHAVQHQGTSTPPTRMSRRDWDGAPAVSQLFGRERAADELKSWIIEDSCRVVLLTGMGGIGKTDLATCLGRGGNRSIGTSTTLTSGIHEHFDFVIWRSLLNAPSPQELFAEVITFLSDHQRDARPSPIKQLDEILSCLQSHRCLVILDNVEAILKPSDPGMRYREGYEPYGAFFELVAKATHRSCLLMTSREKPRAIADLEGARKPVRSMALDGIGAIESKALFAQIGSFMGHDPDWSRLVRQYNGNPLALELAARHIEQVFGGDLAAFLATGSLIFADLRELLDWHLDRLTLEETELVYWLAIEREPVDRATLYDDLVSPSSRQNLPSTLQSLRRRMPLEVVNGSQFALQPVLIEHVTTRIVERAAAALTSAFARSPFSGAPRDSADEPGVLGTHALVKATAKESVRDSQLRLFVAPLADWVTARIHHDIASEFASLLDVWRHNARQGLGYAAGNVINLLTYLRVDLHRANFSHVPVWQACLDGVDLRATDFSFAAFRRVSLKHPFGTVYSLGYSPDGKLLAVGDDNGDIHVFLVASRQMHLHCAGHTDVVGAIAFSRDGRMLASASFDNTIRLWDTRDGHCIDVLLGHAGWVYSLSFSPNGERLASASEDGTWRLWDLRTGQSEVPSTGDSAFLAAVAFSPDGESVAVAGSSGVVRVFPASALDQPSELGNHSGRIRALAFSPKGDVLASGGEDRRIKLWQIANHTLLATLTGHSGSTTALSYSSSGDLLASASEDQTVRLWSTERRECIGQLDVARARVWAVQCSPAERTLATGSEDGAVRLWDMDSHQCLATLRGYSNKTWSLASSPDPALILAGNEDGLLRVWDAHEGRTKLELSGHASRIWSVAHSADGRWAASGSDDLTVRLWDLRAGQCVHVLRGHKDWIRSVAFDPASRFLVSGGEDGAVLVWSVVSGTCVASIEGAMARVFAVAICDGGSCIAVGGSAFEVHLYDPRDGTPRGVLAGHQGWLSALVPFRSMLASCSEDGSVRLWDLSRSACTASFFSGSRVWCGAFSGGGESFLTGSEDGVLRRWAVKSGRCEAQIKAHQGSVWSLAVNAADNTVATVGDDGGIRLWNLPGLDPGSAPTVLRPARPYEGMNITGASGLTVAQREALIALGAISMPAP